MTFATGAAHAEVHAPASAEAADDGGQMRVRATLRADLSSQSALTGKSTDRRVGGEGKLGVHFEIDPGWHLYWRHPGDTGLAPRFEWELAPAQAGPVEWPLPRRFVDEEIDTISYGYEGDVLLAVPLRWDATGPAPERVGVRVDFLVCAHQCIPGSVELSLPFPQQRSAQSAAFFSAWQARLPKPTSATPASVRELGSMREGARLQLALELDACGGRPCATRPGHAGDLFYPYRSDAFARVTASSAPLGEDRAADGRHRITLDARLLDASAGDGFVRGVLILDDAGQRRGLEIAVPWRDTALSAANLSDWSVGGVSGEDAAPARPTPATGTSGLGLLRAVLLGFLGGLLLNLMPCVLPVLALKLFALADLADKRRGEVAWHAGAYTAGILLAMTLLALLVISLRAAGTAVGWGFHLQEPAFVLAVCALLVAFALNLFGVFEIQLDTTRLASFGAQARGSSRSFFDGLLAVILATPCSAPFLGTAVGFAFGSSALVITAIFVSIGLGLAAPFPLVAALPAFGRRLPRSGPWMVQLRTGLGFTLLLAAVWLLWVLGRAAGSDAMAAALALLLLVSLALWLFGLLQRLGRPLPLSVAAGIAMAGLLGGIGMVDLSAPTAAADCGGERLREGVLAWDRDRVQALLAEGRPVFVYFTADWCITCKVNEARVLADPSVARAFRELDVPVFRADWTRRDESIRKELARLGKAGVPAYALYRPDSPDAPRLLPELLSASTLIEELEQVATASAIRHRAGLSPKAPRDPRS